jgi:hypothetical protein
MKPVLYLVVLCSFSAFAQPAHRVSLQLGSATVWLGMDKLTARQTVEAAGMVFPDTQNSGGQVIAVDTVAKRIYTLKFESNKLVYAERNWLNDSNALPSVMDALSSLIDEGTNCTISHAPLSSPDMKMNRVFIDCGERGILLTYGSVNGMTNNTVEEIIGHYR